MGEKISIWLVGNTGLRNPLRITDGLRVFAASKFNAENQLHERENEVAFMDLLNEKGIIHNQAGKDPSGSHARKWRLMFERNGFIYPKLTPKNEIAQKQIGPADVLTPFGKKILKADTYPAIQECFLRSLSVETKQIPDTHLYFSPLRWVLSIMLELEKRTGSSDFNRIEFALWGETTNPSYNLNFVVDNILKLRQARKVAPSKRNFDKEAINERAKNYDHEKHNFLDYADMNMRYLRIGGVLQRKGRGLTIAPSKHILAEQLAKSTGSEVKKLDQYRMLVNGAPLPSDNIVVAKAILKNLESQLKEQHILYDISDLSLNTAIDVNIARRRLEDIQFKTNEVSYAAKQKDEWVEIVDYMTLLENGGGKHEYDEDNMIEIPKDETPAYFEWVIWRALLAIDHLSNAPGKVRNFRLDSDFLPVSTAGGGKGDLYGEFKDFVILTEVTMSTSSRQEAMEGEPVRRHVSDAMLEYQKPVYGLFLAVKIDINTVETFRHGIWYTNEDQCQKLKILPLTLHQFKYFFEYLFENKKNDPEYLKELIRQCVAQKDSFTAPQWKQYIDKTIYNIVSQDNHRFIAAESKFKVDTYLDKQKS